MATNAALKEWVVSHGGDLDAVVEIYDDKMTGTALRLREVDSALHDKHLKPVLYPGTPIVSCPFRLSLSYLNALDVFMDLPAHCTTLLPAEFLRLDPKENARMIGNFFLAQQYLLGADSFWAAYIRSLPQPETSELTTPLYWTIEERAFLDGTRLLRDLEQFEKDLSEEWTKGCAILKATEMAASYPMISWSLYKWAATIYTSRAFTSKLMPPEVYRVMVRDYGVSLFTRDAASSHPRLKRCGYAMNHKDSERLVRFLSTSEVPVLFPLIDIANHNPTAKVLWFGDVQSHPQAMRLLIDEHIEPGAQIFNNYAPKGNTELLLEYGFILPGNDDVFLKLRHPSGNMGPVAAKWKCLESTLLRSREDGVFQIKKRPFTRDRESESDNRSLDVFGVFETGTVETLILSVANQYEQDLMASTNGSRLQTDLQGFFATSFRRLLYIIAAELLRQLDILSDNISESSVNLAQLQTRSQLLALAYRNGQREILETAAEPLRALMDKSVMGYNFRQQLSVHVALNSAPDPCTEAYADLFTIEVAFKWLQENYLSVHDVMIRTIAEELEVDTDPQIDWRSLIESDWVLSLWAYWIFTLIVTTRDDGHQLSNSTVGCWIRTMLGRYNPQDGSMVDAYKYFRGDKDERDSLLVMISSLSAVGWQSSVAINMVKNITGQTGDILNMAFEIANNECFPIATKVISGRHESNDMKRENPKVRQLVVCITTSDPA